MKELTFNDTARNKLANGIQKLTDAVKVTMGPKGRNVLLQKKYKNVLTKDGVSVANEIKLKDNIENIGAELVKEVANNVANDAGDGTTTSTVLTNSILQEGLKYVASGSNPTEIKSGLDKTLKIILKELSKNKREISNTKEIEQVGTISANGDSDIGSMISLALKEVGKDGVITVEESKGVQDELITVKGMEFKQGYISPYFMTDSASMNTVLEDCYVLIYNTTITRLQEILPVLELVQKESKSLLIICEDMTTEALTPLVTNHVRGNIKTCVVKAPGYSDNRKEYLEDIAIVTNGEVIDPKNAQYFTDIKKNLGKCAKSKITKDKCTIIDGEGELQDINERADVLKERLNKPEIKSNEYMIDILKERIAKLIGGIAIIKVSAPSETETKERRDRIDDALGATRAAQEEGIIIGGGSALIKCDVNLDLNGDEALGSEILLRAIEAPIKQIAENARFSGDVIINTVKNSEHNIGWDAKNNEFIDLFNAGIIDSYKVLRLALENAVSVSSMILSTECIVSNVED